MALLAEKYDKTVGRYVNFDRLTAVLVTLAITTFFGLFAGLVGAIGNPILVIIVSGLVIGLMLVASKQALLWFVIIGGVVITGAAQLYLPGARYIRYVVPIAAIVLLLHGAVERISRPDLSLPNKISELGAWAISFAILATVSSIVNWDGIGVAVTGLRGYFQMWPFFAGLLLIRWAPEDMKTLPKGMLIIGALQLPFVLHQYFYLAPLRVGLGYGVVPVDIVAGTFGGNVVGGGANAVLAAFLIVVVACILGLWKTKALSTLAASALTVLFISPVFINEAKISAIYVPLVFLIIFYKDIVKKPARFLAAIAVMLLLLSGLLTALTIAQPSGKLESWSDLVSFTYERQVAGLSERRGQFSQLSRWTALTFWLEEHRSSNPANILLGHGPGASRAQEGGFDFADTVAEKQYGGLKIGATAVSALLWDVGVLGLFIVLGMFVAAYRACSWLSEFYRNTDKFKAGLFQGLSAGIAVLALSLSHKDFFIVNLPFQTLVLLIFGFIVISKRQAETTEECRQLSHD